MTWLATTVFLLLLVALLAIGIAVRHFRRHRALESTLGERRTDPVRYAFVVNPSKPHADEIKEHIRRFCEDHGIHDILFIDTLLDKDGYTCGREAIAAGANVVVACGGDGTVRTVATAVAGTDCALGVIPIGTANLFARNLGIPVDDLDEALRVVISHGSQRVDMGYLTLMDSDEPQRRHGFLLISGIGFDAAMIDSTNPKLKKAIGWMAYFASAIRHLNANRHHGTIVVRKADGTIVQSTNALFHTFLIGNCGRIPVVSLMPQADYADGLLDFALLDAKAGLLGWTDLANDLLYQTITGKPGGSPLTINSNIEEIQGVEAELTLDKPALAEADGDVLGVTRHAHVGIDRQALLVRTPRGIPSLKKSHQNPA
ncbi:MAG: diacylglycerol kinase family protein [Bifidobacteriaceae bacterium]|nr:diacylglycerol kinase family protein [Bifidobacteriaceae bacterium]